MKSTIRISALVWADILVGYAFFVMQNYLTDVWGLSFTHAAAILNIWKGISLVLQPLFFVGVDTLLGHFRMLVISSITYTLGILFVFLSAPPVLANSTGCKQYEKQCIDDTQTALFYSGMALITVGVAGNKVSVKPFLHQQPDEPDHSPLLGCLKIPGLFMVALVGVVGAIALPSIKPWTYRFGIPAVCTAIACLSFLTGLCCFRYNINGPEHTHIANINICRVFSFVMLPMWMAFLVCGMVSSMGNTYFVEQESNLDGNIGKWKAPTQVFMFAQFWLGKLVAYIAGRIFSGSGARVLVAQILGILCCITAAEMEIKRRGIVRRHGLVDRPDAEIPMSGFWLLIQYALLGGLNSLLEKSMKDLHQDEGIDESETPWLEAFGSGVSGLGYMCSVLSVYVAGEESGEPGWFQFTLNRSRLDRYYWVLAILTSVTLGIFVVMRFCCCCRSR